MNWLEKLKDNIFEITRTAAFDCFPPIGSQTEPYYNYRYEHIKQVEIEALKLLEVYKNADIDIVLASVWIHDRCKPQFNGADHGNKAADWVVENLESTGFPKEKVKAVEYAVRNHAGWKKVPLETLEAQIVWDADKIAHQGPNYIFNTIFIKTMEVFKKDEMTISMNGIISMLADQKRDMNNYGESNPFHLEESYKIHIEKAKAVNAFLEAMEKRL